MTATLFLSEAGGPVAGPGAAAESRQVETKTHPKQTAKPQPREIKTMKKTQWILTMAGVVAIGAPAFAQAMASRRPQAEAEAQGTPNYDRPGFATRMHRGSLWVFAEGSEALAAFDAEEKTPAVHTVRPLAGPDNLTVRSPDTNDLTRYLTWRPGFQTRVYRDRLWIFPEGAATLAAFDESGRVPATHVVRPLAGPMGMTIIAEEAETLDAYLAQP